MTSILKLLLFATVVQSPNLKMLPTLLKMFQVSMASLAATSIERFAAERGIKAQTEAFKSIKK